MNSRDKFKAALRHEGGFPIPVWPQAFLFPGAYAKLSQKTYSTDANAFAAAQLTAHKDFGWDAVGSYPDIVMEPEVYGCITEIPEDREPYVTKDVPLANAPELLEKLIEAGPKIGGRMNLVLDCNRQLKKAVGETVFIFAGQRSPLSLACELRGIEQFMVDLIMDPDYANRLLDFAASHAINYAKAQIAAGADVIELGNSSGSLISPEMFAELVAPRLMRVFDAVKEAGGVACLHSCGQTMHLIDHMVGTGADIIEIDYPHTMGEVVKEFPTTTWLGNLDPVSVLMQAKPQEIEKRTSALLEEVRDCGNFVLSTGCEPSMRTPPDNMKAFMHAAHEFNHKHYGA